MKRTMVMLLLVTLLLSASLASAQTELSMWYHGGAWAAEHQVFIDLIEPSTSLNRNTRSTLEAFPQESYNSSIVAAAAAGDLPDIIDVDGPGHAGLGMGWLDGALGIVRRRAG